MKRIIHAVLLVLCVSIMLSVAVTGVCAQETEVKTVKVGFFQMDGYHIQDENGTRSGYGYDFFQYVARYSNLRFEYLGYDKSWSEMQTMLENGEIDVVTSAQKTEEREEKFAFTNELIGTSSLILTVKAGNEKYSDRNYDGMRVGMVENSSRNEQFEDFAAEKGFTYKTVYFDSMDELTDALQDGTIDGAVSSNLRRISNEWIAEEILSSPFYAITRKSDSELINLLDQAISKMDVDSSGWRTKLFNKYYSVISGADVLFNGDERSYLEEAADSGRVFKVIMNPDCIPYTYFEDGEAKGILVDLFAEAANRMGINYEFIVPSDRQEYKQFFESDEIDIVIDGLNDFYTTEENGLEITDVFYSTPIAIVTQKNRSNNIKTLAQPSVSILNEDCYSDIYKDVQVDNSYETLEKTIEAVKIGKADGAYMPYYSAQWICCDDFTSKLECRILAKGTRDYVCAVNSDADYLLLSSLNKALQSLSEDFITSVVTKDTEYIDKELSLIGFLYQNPNIVFILCFIIIIVFTVIAIIVSQKKDAQKKLEHSRKMERYIGYLCDMYYKVLEVDIDLRTRKQYIKHGDKVSIDESSDFTSFDIDSIFPDDKDAANEVFSPTAIRELVNSSEDEKYLEARMKSKDGSYYWYSFLLKLIPKDEEHPCSAMLLIKDVDEIHRERDKAREELSNALDVANSASRSKSTFLSSMSHEIRTPLNAVIGYMTIAVNYIDNKEKVLHCLESSEVAAKHLLSIINDVLDVSSMESGKMKIANERFDLKKLIMNISTVFYQQCKQKDIHFNISINKLEEEWVVGDSMRVNQILMNLMSNAVKFTDDNGVVSLSVTQSSVKAKRVYICFEVSDTGIGMSKEYISRLFMPFEQESVLTGKKYGGTGLGMAITNNLVNLMNGKINVESEQNVGTKITITLPFGRTENKENKPVAKDFSDVRVLVVDDLENERDYIHALLSRCGITSETVNSGEEAICLVAQRKDTPEKFGLCIIDWNMPGMCGVETTKLIHKECDPDIPIIIATAYDISEFEEEAIAAGASKIISKPLFQSTMFDLLVNTYGKYDPTPDESNTIPDLSDLYILLAEDNMMNVEVATEVLKLAGVNVDVVNDGQQAVDKFKQCGEKYDAILMDIQMPVMDGYEATKLIRESDHPLAKTIPIIAMTANAFAEDVTLSLASGMNGHLAKPVDSDELFKTLQEIKRKS